MAKYSPQAAKRTNNVFNISLCFLNVCVGWCVGVLVCVFVYVCVFVCLFVCMCVRVAQRDRESKGMQKQLPASFAILERWIYRYRTLPTPSHHLTCCLALLYSTPSLSSPIGRAHV